MVKIRAAKNILEENQKIAKENANQFRQANLLVVNLMSSPGAGKTTLLEKTLAVLKKEFRLAVIEGDLQTTKDADRIAAFAIPVHQINTQEGCHLDARMIQDVLDHFDLHQLDILFIENVGNLVCPASFELGEHVRAVLLSIPEGSDKPAKYPKMFHCADIVLLTKSDLLPHCPFNLTEAKQDLQKIQPQLNILTVSCHAEEGLELWYQWLRDERKKILQKK